jgi:hypothetical protein
MTFRRHLRICCGSHNDSFDSGSATLSSDRISAARELKIEARQLRSLVGSR